MARQEACQEARRQELAKQLDSALKEDPEKTLKACQQLGQLANWGLGFVIQGFDSAEFLSEY